MIIYQESKGTAQFHPGGNNQRIIRYAEVLLDLAECANETGDIPGAVAYLNQVRARADVAMPPYPTAQFPVGTKAQVTAAIMHEKMVECGDEELRNIDILRWRKEGYFTTEPIANFNPARDGLPTDTSSRGWITTRYLKDSKIRVINLINSNRFENSGQ